MKPAKQTVKTQGSYAHKELAALYLPQMPPESASRQLSRWVRRDPELLCELRSCGFRDGQHIYTPLQIAILFAHLGDPTDPDRGE